MKRILRTEYWTYLQPFLPRHSGVQMLFLGTLSFFGGLAESAVLIIVAVVADGLISGSGTITLLGIETTATTAVIAALALISARMAAILGASWISSRLSARVMLNAQQSLLDAYLNSSYTARKGQRIGDLTTLVIGHGRQVGDLANTYATVATAFCGLLAFGGMSVAVNPIATLGITSIGSLVLVLIRPLRNRSKTAAKRFSRISRGIGAEISQIESLHREIEVFNVTGSILRRTEAGLTASARVLERVRILAGSIPQLFQSMMLGTAVLSLLVVIRASSTTNFAAVGAVVLLLLRSTSSAQQLVTANQQVIERGAYAYDVKNLIEDLNASRRRNGLQKPASLTPIVLQDVDFSYDGMHNVLRSVNVEMDRGELIGIIGPSGAGKSTLVELLLRLRRPTHGSIHVGSTPIDDVDSETFGHKVAFVPQQATIVTGTVGENVSFFRQIPDDLVRSALRSAQLEEDVGALPQGIHTTLGTDERSLSGGQQQRLTIARALAGSPEILILDEPTSALDAVSEAAIRRTLENLPSECLSIIVAHRYSTLRSCTRILLIEDGKIAADATPEEVAQNSEFFRTMIGDSR